MDGDRELFGFGFVDGALAVFEHDCFFSVPGVEEWFDTRAFLFGNVERELPRLRAQVQDGDGEWFARAAKGAERVCRAGSSCGWRILNVQPSVLASPPPPPPLLMTAPGALAVKLVVLVLAVFPFPSVQ